MLNKTQVICCLILTLSLSVVACKNESAENKTESTEVKTAVYQCPMKCDNKTYDKPGNCPVCGMELEKLDSI
jgi:rubrerythrin